MYDIYEYMRDAVRTRAVYDDPDRAVLILTLGLVGEAGEFAEHIKKWLGHGHPVDHVALQKELGDVAWYWANLHDLLRLDPGDTLIKNLAKLSHRYPDAFSTEDSIQRRDTGG